MKISADIFENTEVAFAQKSNTDLQKAKALFQMVGNNSLVAIGSSLTHLALALHLPVSPVFKWTVYKHFCGGETFDECKKTINRLNQSQVAVLLNYGVELKENEADFDKALAQNIEAIHFAAENKSVKAICIKPTGYGRFALYEKLQSGEKLSAEEKQEYALLKKRFEKLCDAALKKQVVLFFDAEESWIQDALDNLVETLMEKYNRQHGIVCNTVQLYRSDRLAYLQQQIQKAKSQQYIYGIKLVRGAYMEKERERATEKNYPSPIHKNKKAVDKDFDEAVNICLDNLDTVMVCIASQSEQSNLLAIQQIDKKKIDRNTPHVIFSQLYGMGDNITFNLAAAGFNATKYLPYGPVKDVVPYLIRRAEENTSVAGQTGRELLLIKKELKRRR